MRTFIAIDFDKRLKNGIADLQTRIRNKASSGRWKYIDNFHLTLKFLDEINDIQLYDINTNLKEVCCNNRSFTLNVAKLGYFPGKGSIRVLWLGFEGDLESLQSLHQDIDNSLYTLGFEEEDRKYTPHVTIGQDVILNEDLTKLTDCFDEMDFEPIDVNSVCLFKSEQIGKKRVYTKIGEYFLYNKKIISHRR